jgi:hypothetical protein
MGTQQEIGYRVQQDTSKPAKGKRETKKEKGEENQQ